MQPWLCSKCGLPHALRDDVKSARCFRCDAELHRDDAVVITLRSPAPPEASLVMHDGCWAIRIGDDLYVFPPETTRDHAESVLREALAVYRGH